MTDQRVREIASMAGATLSETKPTDLASIKLLRDGDVEVCLVSGARARVARDRPCGTDESSILDANQLLARLAPFFPNGTKPGVTYVARQIMSAEGKIMIFVEAGR